MKKWLLRIGLGIVSLVVLLYGFVFLRSVIPTYVNDRDLAPRRTTLSDDANGFVALENARVHLWWPNQEEKKIYDAAYAEIYDEARRNGQALPSRGPTIPREVMENMDRKSARVQGYLLSATNWDAALAATVLNNNQETLKAWDRAVALPDFQVPEITAVDEPLPYLAKWKELAQLTVVRENNLLHSGRDKEAFDQIVNHVLLGRKMQNSHSSVIGYLVGIAVSTIGLNQANQWVGKARLTAPQLKTYIRQLDYYSPSEEGAAFENAFRAEYQSLAGTLTAWREGKLMDSESGKAFPRPTPFWPAFNYSRTKAMFADAYRVLLKTAPLHHSELESEYQKNAAKLPDFERRPRPVSIILSGNAAGRVMFYLMLPAVLKTHEKKCRANVQLHATRTILALRAYQLTHGKLPPDLNALVPEFLPRVPADDFDGQPLRYSPAQKMVYSVGKNLKDDDGDDRSSDAPDSERHLDLGFKFDF